MAPAIARHASMSLTVTVADLNQSAPAEEGETVLGALLAHGVGFAYSCQAGNCGTCKCELVSGDILELEHSEHALAPEQRAKGIILACRTQVWDDAVIRRIDAEDLVMHPSRVMRCRVLELEALTHDIRGVHLAIEAGGPLTFSAGQYAQLEFAPGLSRHYSMANTPDEAELVFHVRHVPGGRTSRYVAEQLKIGDRVKVSGPLGIAYLREQHAGPVLLIAGGSGLAPIQSIASTLLGRGYKQPVALYFGVRAERDLYREAKLKDLAARYPSFKYHVVLSEQKGDSGRRFGLVHEAVDG